MSISLNDHEERIKKLETSGGGKKKYTLGHTFSNIVGQTPYTFEFNQSYEDLDFIIFSAELAYNDIGSIAKANHVQSLIYCTGQSGSVAAANNDYVIEATYGNFSNFSRLTIQSTNPNVKYLAISNIWGLKLYYNFSTITIAYFISLINKLRRCKVCQ